MSAGTALPDVAAPAAARVVAGPTRTYPAGAEVVQLRLGAGAGGVAPGGVGDELRFDKV